MRLVLVYRETGESLSTLCRHFGISRKTAYKWLGRYRVGGVQALRDRSRRPGYCAKAYRSFWRERLVKAREARPQWGAKKLRSLLRKSYPGAKCVPAVSTLALWLRRSGLAHKRKRRARRGPELAWKPLPAARQCNDVWSVDFKGWFRTRDGWRCEPLTVRDVFSRFVLEVALLPNQSDAAVRRAFVQVFRRYGLPKAIRVDHGAPFGGKGALGLSRLSVWWLRLGISVEFIRRAHPQDNAAHEQMHRIFKADTASPPALSFRAQQRRTTAWKRYYNCERPHEALGQRVPAQIYWPSNRPMPEQLSPVSYPCGWNRRRVRNRGHIKWQGRERFVGRAFVGELVGLKNVAAGIHEVYLASHLIGLLYERDLAGMRPACIARHP